MKWINYYRKIVIRKGILVTYNYHVKSNTFTSTKKTVNFPRVNKFL